MGKEQCSGGDTLVSWWCPQRRGRRGIVWLQEGTQVQRTNSRAREIKLPHNNLENTHILETITDPGEMVIVPGACRVIWMWSGSARPWWHDSLQLTHRWWSSQINRNSGPLSQSVITCYLYCCSWPLLLGWQRFNWAEIFKDVLIQSPKSVPPSHCTIHGTPGTKRTRHNDKVSGATWAVKEWFSDMFPSFCEKWNLSTVVANVLTWRMGEKTAIKERRWTCFHLNVGMTNTFSVTSWSHS